MKRFFSKISSFLAFFLATGVCLFLSNCANIGSIEGGAKDTRPPRLDSLHSTPNRQTRFQKQTIELTFDEWVQLSDVFNQVVISPPLEFRPDIRIRKKTVQVVFDEREKLRDSATYVINFGKAIKDLTEGNPAEMVFVFSTGEFIDSLSVSGKVVDAYSGDPVEEVLFLLYENLADSALRKERPFYFARTSKEGSFRVENMKAGTFKAAALLDQNLNYRFDSEAEKVAFLEQPLEVGREVAQPKMQADTARMDSILADSIRVDSLSIFAKAPQKQIVMRLFQEDRQLFLRAKEAAVYGLVKLIFNREPFEAMVRYDSVGQSVFLEKEQDTIRIWYDLPTDVAWNVYVQRDTATDTVRVQGGLRANFLTTGKLTAPPPNATDLAKHNFQKPYAVSFSHPLAGFDASKIRLLEDTSKIAVQPSLRMDSLSRRNLLLDFAWKEGLKYEVEILPGGVTGIFGLANVDTVRRLFTVALQKDLGTLTLHVRNLRLDTAYVVQVVEKTGSPPLKIFQVSGVADFRTTLPALTPAIYTVEIIEDLDRNGRWTTGNYDLHRQPERVVRKTLEQLRANWELDAEVRWE